MKKIILIIAIIGLTLNLSAQSQKLKDKTLSNTEYIAKAMDFNDLQKNYLYKTMLNNSHKGYEMRKGLSKEERKEVNKELRKELKTSLSIEFSNDEIKQIFALLKEKKELDKKQNN